MTQRIDAAGLVVWVALAGQRICVTAGIYAESLQLPAHDVELIGLDGPEATVIQGDGTQPVLRIVSGQTAATRIAGFTVRGGHYQADTAEAGGIHVAGSSPTLADLVIEENLGTGLALRDSTAWVSGCRITGNTGAWYGGGVQIWGGAHFDLATVTMAHVLVTDNEGGYNGGLFIEDSQVTGSHVAVTGNYGFLGGGIFVENAEVTLDRFVIYGNGYAPAAIGLENGAQLTLTNGIVAYNSSGALDDIQCHAGECALEVSYTALWGDTVAAGVAQTGSGFLTLYPEFLDATGEESAGWDLHLVAGSAAVDAGDPATSDPDTGVSDLGLYGGDGADGWDLDGDGFPEWWRPGPYDFSTDPDAGLDCDDRDALVFPGSGC
jgi:hypothetical protein